MNFQYKAAVLVALFVCFSLILYPLFSDVVVFTIYLGIDNCFKKLVKEKFEKDRIFIGEILI